MNNLIYELFRLFYNIMSWFFIYLIRIYPSLVFNLMTIFAGLTVLINLLWMILLDNLFDLRSIVLLYKWSLTSCWLVKCLAIGPIDHLIIDSIELIELTSWLFLMIEQLDRVWLGLINELFDRNYLIVWPFDHTWLWLIVEYLIGLF